MTPPDVRQSFTSIAIAGQVRGPIFGRVQVFPAVGRLVSVPPTLTWRRGNDEPYRRGSTASACCAPVLAGVAVLSGAAASFPVALAIGAAYVGGMVAPLAVVALLWDKRRERATRLLTDRTVRLRFGNAAAYPGALPAGKKPADTVVFASFTLQGPAAKEGAARSSIELSAFPVQAPVFQAQRTATE